MIGMDANPNYVIKHKIEGGKATEKNSDLNNTSSKQTIINTS